MKDHGSVASQDDASRGLSQADREPAKVWYRYEDRRSPNEDEPPLLGLRTFPVLDETDKTVRLREFPWDFYNRHTKRVLKVARKRWAYPTMELAWQSFKIRKGRQAGHLRSQLQHVNDVRELLGLLATDAPSAVELESTRRGLIRVRPSPPWALFSPPTGSQTSPASDGEGSSSIRPNTEDQQP